LALTRADAKYSTPAWNATSARRRASP
jgi:hypothetical protein